MGSKKITISYENAGTLEVVSDQAAGDRHNEKYISLSIESQTKHFVSASFPDLSLFH